jgi:hypothetical protein
MNEVRQILEERIAQRRNYAQSQGLDFEKLARAVSFNEEVQRWILELLEHQKAAILIKPYIIPTNQGPLRYLLGWVKKQAHQLAIYYAYLLGQKQILFNASVVEAMAFHQAQTDKLQETVNSLEAKIQRLEALLSTKEVQV